MKIMTLHAYYLHYSENVGYNGGGKPGREVQKHQANCPRTANSTESIITRSRSVRMGGLLKDRMGHLKLSREIRLIA